MKCIKCGQEMYSIGSAGSDTACNNYVNTKYVCPKCGYEVSDRFNPLVYYAAFFQPDDAKINYGWICPKCGAVLSPSTKECPYCTPYKATCGPISGFPITSPLTCDVTTQTQGNITATIKGDLQANKNTEEKENENNK